MESAQEYQNFFGEVKNRIRTAQYEALRAVNKELVGLYWDLGKMIVQKQIEAGWGKSVVETLASDLQKEFPGERGYSSFNLWLMVRLYNEYQNDRILESMIQEIGWSHNIVILKKCRLNEERQFYIHATKKYAWTTRILDHQIDNKTFEKYLLNQTSFDQLQGEHCNVPRHLVIKDHYTFDFLELSDSHTERQLEKALINHVRGFLLELGGDFSFIGSQYKLTVEDEDFFIDLLLYHRRLQCLVAVELKTGGFKPEYKGKMEFYLTVLNIQMKLPHENEAIGIIICKNKKRLIVEYSLMNSALPIGVASYSTTPVLPEYYKKLLPDPEEMANRVERWLKGGG